MEAIGQGDWHATVSLATEMSPSSSDNRQATEGILREQRRVSFINSKMSAKASESAGLAVYSTDEGDFKFLSRLKGAPTNVCTKQVCAKSSAKPLEVHQKNALRVSVDRVIKLTSVECMWQLTQLTYTPENKAEGDGGHCRFQRQT